MNGHFHAAHTGAVGGVVDPVLQMMLIPALMMQPCRAVALFAAFTSAGCFIQIPLAGGIPIVIQDMMAMLSGLILGPIYGTLSVFIFLVLGSIGLPVFSGKGGFDKILNGPTGGFLIGYMIAALAGGLIVHFFVKNPYKTIAQDSETPETTGTTTEFSAKTNILNWIFFALAAITATVICFAFGIASVAAVQNIEVDGIKFAIPDGYTEDMSMAKNGEVDENGFKTFDHTYFDSNYNMLSVTVFYDGGSVDFNSLKEPSEVEKTIKGHKGWFEFDKESELYFFTYVDNDKIVMITAEDEGLFEKVIV